MRDAYPTPIRRSGSLDQYVAGQEFSIAGLQGFSDCAQAQARVIRRVAAGKLEVEAGNKLIQMIATLARTFHFQRKAELEERRLDLLGAAAEQGAAVFEGLAIVPPASRMQPVAEPEPEPEVINIEPGPLVKIDRPNRRGRKNGHTA